MDLLLLRRAYMESDLTPGIFIRNANILPDPTIMESPFTLPFIVFLLVKRRDFLEVFLLQIDVFFDGVYHCTI